MVIYERDDNFELSRHYWGAQSSKFLKVRSRTGKPATMTIKVGNTTAATIDFTNIDKCFVDLTQYITAIGSYTITATYSYREDGILYNETITHNVIINAQNIIIPAMLPRCGLTAYADCLILPPAKQPLQPSEKQAFCFAKIGGEARTLSVKLVEGSSTTNITSTAHTDGNGIQWYSFNLGSGTTQRAINGKIAIYDGDTIAWIGDILYYPTYYNHYINALSIALPFAANTTINICGELQDVTNKDSIDYTPDMIQSYSPQKGTHQDRLLEGGLQTFTMAFKNLNAAEIWYYTLLFASNQGQINYYVVSTQDRITYNVIVADIDVTEPTANEGGEVIVTFTTE